MECSISGVIKEIRENIKEEERLNDKIVLSLFADLSPNMVTERKRLKIAYELNIVNELYDICLNRNRMISRIDLDRMTMKLIDLGISEDIAKELVSEIWIGISENINRSLDGDDVDLEESCSLGEGYYGNEVEQDYKKAFELYAKAAKKGNMDAQFAVGFL